MGGWERLGARADGFAWGLIVAALVWAWKQRGGSPVAPKSRACTPCHERFPLEDAYRQCPLCGQRTHASPVEPTLVDEDAIQAEKSAILLMSFDAFYERRVKNDLESTARALSSPHADPWKILGLEP